MTIQVHHLEYSRSVRVLWLLEELGLDYEIQAWQRDAGFRAPEAAKRVHPLGRFPMVEVDGHVLAESGAIVEYFAERQGKLRPTDPQEKIQCTFFLHYAEGSVMPPLLVQLLLEKIKRAPVPFFVKPIARRIASEVEKGYSGPALDLHLGFVERTLGERAYFAGDQFTIADIQMLYPVEAALRRASGTYPNMRAWLDKVSRRDAFQRAAAKGGSAMPPD